MGQLYDMNNKSEILDTSDLKLHTPSYGDGNGGGDDMLERVKKLEEKVNSLVTDIAVIKSNYATSSDVSNVKTEIANAKADLHSALRIQALTIIGSVLATVGIAATVIVRSLPH
ncbi:hypothetical protein [Pantoea sp. GbtcB22]|uniref:hypothetical protein n=1 Tax=Pantoea sp. GbtcB22 TaxID=2824767 RepID=UPI001C2F19E1|nr:hypothetical protein [Pantoea sp. GbtcB22]